MFFFIPTSRKGLGNWSFCKTASGWRTFCIGSAAWLRSNHHQRVVRWLRIGQVLGLSFTSSPSRHLFGESTELQGTGRQFQNWRAESYSCNEQGVSRCNNVLSSYTSTCAAFFSRHLMSCVLPVHWVLGHANIACANASAMVWWAASTVRCCSLFGFVQKERLGVCQHSSFFHQKKWQERNTLCLCACGWLSPVCKLASALFGGLQNMDFWFLDVFEDFGDENKKHTCLPGLHWTPCSNCSSGLLCTGAPCRLLFTTCFCGSFAVKFLSSLGCWQSSSACGSDRCGSRVAIWASLMQFAFESSCDFKTDLVDKLFRGIWMVNHNRLRGNIENLNIYGTFLKPWPLPDAKIVLANLCVFKKILETPGLGHYHSNHCTSFSTLLVGWEAKWLDWDHWDASLLVTQLIAGQMQWNDEICSDTCCAKCENNWKMKTCENNLVKRCKEWKWRRKWTVLSTERKVEKENGNVMGRSTQIHLFAGEKNLRLSWKMRTLFPTLWLFAKDGDVLILMSQEKRPNSLSPDEALCDFKFTQCCLGSE